MSHRGCSTTLSGTINAGGVEIAHLTVSVSARNVAGSRRYDAAFVWVVPKEGVAAALRVPAVPYAPRGAGV